MHEHNECEHDLKLCKVCNVVYCTKCGEEWKREIKWNYQIMYTDTVNLKHGEHMTVGDGTAY